MRQCDRNTRAPKWHTTIAGRVADVKRGANSFEENADAIGTLVMTFSSQRIVLSSPKLRPLYRKQVPMVAATSPAAEELGPQKIVYIRPPNERT